jgi:PAS domain S-box-containing protein
MKYRSLERKIALGFGSALIILSVTGWLTYRSMLTFLQDAKMVEHTYQVIGKLESLFSLIKDAEAARRGYTLSLDKSHLEQYRATIPLIHRELNEVKFLTGDNVEQQRKIANLTTLISQKLKLVEESTRAAQIDPNNREQQAMYTNQGKAQIDRIRGVISEMNSLEKRLLQQRANEAKRSARQTKFSFALANLMALALVGLASFIIHLDIAERRRTENALRRSEHRLQSILDNSNAFIHIKDLQGRYLLANHWYERVFQKSREAIIGKTDYDIFPKEFADEYRENDQKVIQNRAPIHIEESAPGADGKHTHISIKFPLIEDEKIYAICGISTDITTLKKNEAAIRSLNEDLQNQAGRLEAAIDELESFSYSVSHDLRAPLRAIDGFSELMINEYNGKLDAEGLRLLQIIRSNTRHMGQLIDDLLAFSRLSRKELHKRHVNMTDLAKTVAEDLKYPLENATSYELSIQDMPTVQADPALIRQVWTNLLSNAVKFSQKHSHPMIEVGSYTEDSKNVYYVKDNGVGFNMSYAHKLFRVFERLHRAEEYPGTGVGLAIVERIIKRHGGSVWAEGRPNDGATFYFSLPTESKLE